MAFHSLLGSGEKFTAGLKEPTRTVSRYLIDNMYSSSVLQQYADCYDITRCQPLHLHTRWHVSVQIVKAVAS